MIGDLVTRDGSDLHRIVGTIAGVGCHVVRCILAPEEGWVDVGAEWIADAFALDLVTPEDEARMRCDRTRTP